MTRESHQLGVLDSKILCVSTEGNTRCDRDVTIPSWRPAPPNRKCLPPTVLKEWPERGAGTWPVAAASSHKIDCGTHSMQSLCLHCDVASNSSRKPGAHHVGQCKGCLTKQTELVFTARVRPPILPQLGDLRFPFSAHHQSPYRAQSCKID